MRLLGYFDAKGQGLRFRVGGNLLEEYDNFFHRPFSVEPFEGFVRMITLVGEKCTASVISESPKLNP